MIARRYDLPLRALIDANHLDPPFQVSAGTVLRLPQARYHVVQAGETLYSVSRSYGVEISTLASLNHLNEPYAIRSGQALTLPPQVMPRERAAALVPMPPPEPSAPSSVPASPPAPSMATAPPPGPKPRLGRVFAWPLEGRIIEGYGTGPSGTHNDGINIAARVGDPVRAADAGRVAYAGNELRGYGNLVLIKHAGGYMTAYAHNGKLLVKRGEAVKRGQEIATAGATGSVNAPQLHFEIRRGTHALDPTDYLPDLRASAN
jgi:murein DD-endopeptidase MepM/ murein hydrolase activator NlpD